MDVSCCSVCCGQGYVELDNGFLLDSGICGLEVVFYCAIVLFVQSLVWACCLELVVCDLGSVGLVLELGSSCCCRHLAGG
ncbi:unnamed protein product [Cuscuta campestris]|uniref:Uncharacterized protein n=1 Tax=Cuscuta campestris TaxID=132261 RepID=A0A484NGI2_9ASTE|nr:unnamed protein product [Cuscuta campestris]